MSISNGKDNMKSLKEISIPNLMFNTKSLYLIEMSLFTRTGYTKFIYRIEKYIPNSRFNRKVYMKSLYLIERYI